MQNTSRCVAVAWTIVALQSMQTIQAQSVVGQTEILAALAGRYATPSRGQENIRFYGTDLGWSFEHEGQIWILFGDTYPDWFGGSLQPDADDVLAKIPLSTFRNGDAVDHFIAAHPAAVGQPKWRAAAPPLNVAVNQAGLADPIRIVHDGRVLASAIGLTPEAGFSNARKDDTAGAFALFFRNEPVRCDAAGSCSDGYDCDRGLGRCSAANVLDALCVVGTNDCNCLPTATGFCQDRGSSVYDSSERGRIQAVVMNHEVGNAIRGQETRFASQSWATNRFYNSTLRTVNDFDATRTSGSGNDYRAADGVTTEREGVFVWGRPGFGGVRAQARDAQLYLAWVAMPSYDASGHFAWQPRYFAGIDAAGTPRFVERQVDAVALDLDAGAPGEQPEELVDIVSQMAISWVPGLHRWVMLYGGDLDGALIPPMFGSDVPLLHHDQYGAVQMRSAEHPWGPWTAPQRVLLAADGSASAVGQYGPGGVLHHPNCNLLDCAAGDGIVTQNDRGFYYGVNIVDTWTSARAASVDLYWFVSTWNPYQVLLVKTSLPNTGL